MKLRKIYESIISEQIGFYTILPFIEDKLGIKVGDFIGSGQRSDVFALGNDKVLKITSSKTDVEGFLVAKKNPEYPMPKVYGIYKIDPSTKRKEIKRFMRDIWVIIAEKIKAGSSTSSDIEFLDKWFEKNTDLIPDDLSRDNVGRRGNEVLYLDPSFESTQENADGVEILK